MKPSFKKPELNYRCSKCNNREFEVEGFSGSGGAFSRIFDVQNKKYTAVICKRCAYTEFYKAKVGKLSQVFDFFTT